MTWLIAALVFLLPVGTRRIFGHASVPAYEWNAMFVSATDLVLVALIGWVIVRKNLWEIVRPIDRGARFLILFLAAVGLSVLWYDLHPLSLFRYAKLLLFATVALFTRAAFRNGNGRLLLSLFVVAALIESVLAIGQFFSQHDFGLQVFGESPLDPRAAGIAKINVGNVKIVRAYGTFPHPNVLAGYLVAALFMVFARSLMSPRGAAWLAAIFPLMLGLFVSFSRAAFVALGIGCVFVGAVYAIRCRQRIPAHTRNVFIAFLYAVLISALVYSAFFLPFWQERAIPQPTEGAVVERIFYADAAIKMVRDHPLVGVGWGRFSDSLPDYVEPTPSRIPSTSFPLWLLQPVHNMYLLIAAEAGIIALILFLVWVRTLLVISLAHGGIAILPIAAGFSALLVAGLFDHFLITSQQGALAFWFFAGILMAGEKLEGGMRRA